MEPIEMSSPHSYSTSIHTIGLSATVWPQFEGRVLGDPPIWGVWGVRGELGGRELHQSIATHVFPIPLNPEFCSISRRFAAIPMSSFDPPIRPPIWGVRVDLGGRKVVPIEISSPHSYSTSIHTIGLYCTV